MSDEMSSATGSTLNELMSALMDGELDDLQRRRVVKTMLADPAALARWRRLHLARAALRGDSPQMTDETRAERLRAAIELEETYRDGTGMTAPGAVSAKTPRSRRLALLAVAAAAGAGVMVWSGVGTGRDTVTSGIVDRAPAPAANVQRVAAGVDRGLADSPQDARRARMYMLLHAQQAAINQSSQVIAFVKAVSYETP